MRPTGWIALIAAAAVLALGANYLLLGYGGSRADPAGRLGPGSLKPAVERPAVRPATTTTPAEAPGRGATTDGDHRDDGHGGDQPEDD